MVVEHAINLQRNLNITDFVSYGTDHGVLMDLRFELNRTDRSWHRCSGRPTLGRYPLPIRVSLLFVLFPSCLISSAYLLNIVSNH